jgi:hypothetical protein
MKRKRKEEGKRRTDGKKGFFVDGIGVGNSTFRKRAGLFLQTETYHPPSSFIGEQDTMHMYRTISSSQVAYVCEVYTRHQNSE